MEITNQQLYQRIVAVFTKRLEVEPDRLSRETQRGDLEDWDSFGHLAVVQGLSEEFDVEISPEDALEMETIYDIERIISELL